MTWDGLNRRRFPRVVYPCLVKLASKTGGTRTFLTHTENVGIGGVCITSKDEIKLFTDVEVEIDLLDAEGNIISAGKVVWSVRRKSIESFKPLFYDIGIEFVKLSKQQQDHLNATIDRIIKNGATILTQPD